MSGGLRGAAREATGEPPGLHHIALARRQFYRLSKDGAELACAAIARASTSRGALRAFRQPTAAGVASAVRSCRRIGEISRPGRRSAQSAWAG